MNHMQIVYVTEYAARKTVNTNSIGGGGKCPGSQINYTALIAQILYCL